MKARNADRFFAVSHFRDEGSFCFLIVFEKEF